MAVLMVGIREDAVYWNQQTAATFMSVSILLKRYLKASCNNMGQEVALSINYQRMID